VTTHPHGAGLPGTRLHGIRHPGEVTAASALAWLASSAGTGEVIGYLLAPDRAEWFRCDGMNPRGPAGPRDLAPAFEVFATDRRRHLRWVHGASGTGQAVSLAENPGWLPPGEPLPAEPARTRLGGAVARLLAGRVTTGRVGWATLASARYEPCDVPVNAEPGQEVWADLAEYVVQDEHGNLSVTDTVLLGLRARQADQPRAAASRNGGRA
jgi:hypothetical protein